MGEKRKVSFRHFPADKELTLPVVLRLHRQQHPAGKSLPENGDRQRRYYPEGEQPKDSNVGRRDGAAEHHKVRLLPLSGNQAPGEIGDAELSVSVGKIGKWKD